MKYKKLIIVLVIVVLLVILSTLVYQEYYHRKAMITEYLKDQITEIESSSEPLEPQTKEKLKRLKNELGFVVGIGDYQGSYYEYFDNNKVLENYYYEKVK